MTLVGGSGWLIVPEGVKRSLPVGRYPFRVRDIRIGLDSHDCPFGLLVEVKTGRGNGWELATLLVFPSGGFYLNGDQYPVKIEPRQTRSRGQRAVELGTVTS